MKKRKKYIHCQQVVFDFEKWALFPDTGSKYYVATHLIEHYLVHTVFFITFAFKCDI